MTFLRFVILALVLAASLAATTADATTVSFRFRPAQEATTVSVAGSFNEWNLSAHPLVDPDGDGIWEATLELDPGRVAYKFVVNGSEWTTDASATDFEEDGFGGKNSVLIVEGEALTVEGVPAAPLESAGGEVVPLETVVTFRFRPTRAVTTVSVAGNFNDWNPGASPMSTDSKRDGVYELAVRLAPGQYLYKFVVDGHEWITDESAAAFADDGFGGQNSVLEVGREAVWVGEPRSDLRPNPLVTFRFDAKDRRVNAVSLAGSFNDWDAAAHLLTDADGDGVWEIRFRLGEGDYEYQFVIDGDEWVEDPHAGEATPDGFGGRKAHFRVGDRDMALGAPR